MTTHHAQPEDTTEQDPNPSSPLSDQPTSGTDAGDAPEIVDEVLIEEVGIDGMCGVY